MSPVLIPTARTLSAVRSRTAACSESCAARAFNPSMTVSISLRVLGAPKIAWVKPENSVENMKEASTTSRGYAPTRPRT